MSCTWFFGRARFVAFALFFAMPYSASANTPESESVNVHIVDMAFGDLLDYLGSELGVQFSGSRNSRIRISGLSISGSDQQIIDAIMREARMDHFSFNGQIYFEPVENRSVRLVPLVDSITAGQAREALADAGLNIPGYDVTEVSNGRALVLSGPVRYLALSEGVLSALEVVPDVAETPLRVRRGGILEVEGASVSPTQLSTN